MQAILDPQLNDLQLAERLGAMIRFRTVSNADHEKIDREAFLGLHAYLEQTYPLVHKHLTKTVINDYSLLYHWKGTGEGKEKPLLLMAHQDVVPVSPGTEGDWVHGGFSGEIADGCVWGRGAIDIKVMILGEMEAVEYLLSQGFTPKQDIYLAYGHDEELIGKDGCTRIAQYLQEQGVELGMVLDEGGSFGKGERSGVPGKVIASIGIFEKGYCDLQLTIQDEGGHSSRPGESTALGELARAIDAIERNKFAPALPDPVRRFYQTLAPYLSDPTLQRAAQMADTDPQPLIDWLLQSPRGNALVRTTTAATQAWASPAPNILPQKAQAVFNFRLNPQETVADVLAHCLEVVDNPRVQMEVLKGNDPSAISDADAPAFDMLKRTILSVAPEAIVTPSEVVGGTDSRNFCPLCRCVYRFSPFMGAMEYSATVHATNERIAVEGLSDGVTFFVRLIQNYQSMA